MTWPGIELTFSHTPVERRTTRPLCGVGLCGTHRSLLMDQNTALLRQIVDLGIFHMNYHIEMLTHGTPFVEPVVGAG